MNILFISHNIPNTPTIGGSERVFHLLKYLSINNKVMFIAPYSDNEKLKQFRLYNCKFNNNISFHLIKVNFKTNKIKMFLNMILLQPSFVFKRSEKKQFEKIISIIRDELNRNCYDIIHLDTIKSFQFFQPFISKKIPIVCLLPDSMDLYYKKICKLENTSIRKIWLIIQTWIINRYEKMILTLTQMQIVNSDVDQMHIKNIYGKNVYFIPNGVDLEYYKFEPEKEDILIFAGVMSYDFNIDAMLYFCYEVWPKLYNSFRNYKLYIVGKDPSEALLKLDGKNGIVVTGYVNDIREYLKKARIFISPLRYGTGFKNKILMAMASRIPIVATQISCDGIDCKDSEHILIANNSISFIEQIKKIINDKTLEENLVNNSYELVRSKYSWKLYSNRIEEVYKNLIMENYNEY